MSDRLNGETTGTAKLFLKDLESISFRPCTIADVPHLILDYHSMATVLTTEDAMRLADNLIEWVARVRRNNAQFQNRRSELH